MIASVEINNFQSHRHTFFDFKKGINTLCGESDNGKTAVIRAIRWVYENRPLGTDKLNSSWNEGFKEPMSVKLNLDDGYSVERIRTKDRNGYTYIEPDGNIVELSATGTDVPQKIKDILNLSDVNFQFQMDSPYLISMSSGEASRYLNNIIRLDSVDKVLSIADSNKRELNSELKVVEKDIKDYELKVESLSWIDEADRIQKRIDRYNEVIDKRTSDLDSLKESLNSYLRFEKDRMDLTKQKDILKRIEDIKVPDCFELENSIESFESSFRQAVDLTKQKDLLKRIEDIKVPDCSELEKSISDYESLFSMKKDMEKLGMELEDSLPKVCPLCGSKLD